MRQQECGLRWPQFVKSDGPPVGRHRRPICSAPRFEGDKLIKPAYYTVFPNGVLVHHHIAVVGRVAHKDPVRNLPHGDRFPLLVQDHRNPVRIRNVWIRPAADSVAQ